MTSGQGDPAIPPSGESSPTDLVERARRIHRLLGEEYPNARCELNHQGPFELLVATVLSAQCTDERVNQVTPPLFSEFPNAQSLAEAPRERIEQLIRPTGFFHAKAESIQGLSRNLVERYGGEVPGTLDELFTLRGVGRKTANVVLGNAFGVPGLPVDTHVGRLARRLGLTTENDPNAIERDLAALIDRRDWTSFSHRLIFHGRRCCASRKPACDRCPLTALCPSSTV
ncbi:MAG: endonuclease III [Demequinaceae bacterium]|nr:endonuclease III [Demequinaceae bacterium]